MNPPIKTLVTIQYHADGRPWEAEVITNPAWHQVEHAILRMDDKYFPIVVLSALDCATDEEAFEDDDSFHLIGGCGNYALFQCTGPWQYSNPAGDDVEVRLWQSDQGYTCARRNIADLDTTLALTHIFFQTGSFNAVRAACSR